MKFIKKVAKFIKDVAVAAKNRVVSFVKGLYHHTEGIVIVLLATLGVNVIYSQAPFLYTLPLWVEATMVIPVLSVFTVFLLIKAMEWRDNRRRWNAKQKLQAMVPTIEPSLPFEPAQ